MTNSMIATKTDYINSIPFNYDYYNNFIEYTDVKETTLKGYKSHLLHFFDYLRKENITNPTRQDVKNYKEYINNQNYTTGTKSQYLRAVKHFFKWANSEGIYPNIADNIKGVKVSNDNTKKEPFNETDIKIILNNIDRNTIQGKRNYAMLLLIITGGLRIIEVQRADIQDIQVIKGQTIIYIQGKGHDEKDAYIKIIDEVKTAINDYLQTRQPYKNNEPLFTSTSNRALNERITETSISRLIKNIFRQSGYDSNKLTAHSLRHTSNTLLFKSGADLFKVQQHARHKDPKTTEIYLHINDRDSDTSEKDIYNQIFNPKKQDTLKEIYKNLDELSDEKQKKVLNYIRLLNT